MKQAINICGIPHEILEVEDNFSSDSVHFGEIEYKECIIKLNKDMPQAMKHETLCHEVLHGILVHIGREDLPQDESFVQALGNAIAQSFTADVTLKGE